MLYRMQASLKTSTLFKSWSINDILAHLHIWNIAAQLTLTDPDGFVQFGAFAMGHIAKGESHIEMQNTYLEGLKGQALVKAWRDYYNPMADNFLSANPQARLKWVGPDMSARSCIIARQMEHWAHAQAIFDVLGVERKNTARLKNIAHIGVTTYSWSFKVNNLEPLLRMQPHGCLLLSALLAALKRLLRLEPEISQSSHKKSRSQGERL